MTRTPVCTFLDRLLPSVAVQALRCHIVLVAYVYLIIVPALSLNSPIFNTTSKLFALFLNAQRNVIRFCHIAFMYPIPSFSSVVLYS